MDKSSTSASDGAVEVVPRIGLSVGPAVSVREPQIVDDSRAVAKTFMSVSNEYWLIGIIIVLITVVLMLIVYIVKIRQSSNGTTTLTAGKAPPGADGPKAPQEDAHASAPTSEPTKEHLAKLAEKKFVSRALEHEEEEEGDAEEMDPTKLNSAPLFVMDGSAKAMAETVHAPPEKEPVADAPTAMPEQPATSADPPQPQSRARRGRGRGAAPSVAADP